jgi:hypothetical protein
MIDAIPPHVSRSQFDPSAKSMIGERQNTRRSDLVNDDMERS